MALGTEATRNSNAWPSCSLTKPRPVQDGVPPGVAKRSTTSRAWEAIQQAGAQARSRPCAAACPCAPALPEALPRAGYPAQTRTCLVPAPGCPQLPKLGGQGRAGSSPAAPARSDAPPCAGGSGIGPWPHCTWGTQFLSEEPCSAQPQPLPRPQHSLEVRGTAHIAVTRAAAKQVMAQAPVARLGERRSLGARNRPPLTPQQRVQLWCSASTTLGENRVPGPLAPTVGLPGLRPLSQGCTLSPH